MRGRIGTGALGLAAALAALVGGHALTVAPAMAQQAAAPGVRAPIVNRFTGRFNGQRVAYRSIVSETSVAQADGTPGARLVSTAYVADMRGDAAQRPVIFLFNGGPITASAYLHMGAFGPRRVVFPADLSADVSSLPVVDNPDTLLDVADLVFIDPAGTGYSRVAEGVDPRSYFSVVADGQQVTAFIDRWLRDNGRRASPVYLFGESYGTLRAAQVARQLIDLPEPIQPAGVVLFGQALNIIEFSQRPANILSYVVSMPTLAATAWYHNRIDRRGRTLEAFVEESRVFAHDDYLQALYRGTALPAAERARIARRLEELTGVSAAYYLAHDLRISKEQYRRELFADRGLILGRYDARYVAPLNSEPGGGDPSAPIAGALERAFLDHARTRLGVTWSDDYLFSANVGGLAGWGWGATSPFGDWPYMSLISDVMRRTPNFRVMVGAGHYDTSTTTGASEYALAQTDWPRDRTSLTYYEGGHMAYSDEGSFQKLMRDMRAFIRPGE